MAQQTEIAWCDSTYNPWRGCTKVSAGCKNCYAEKLITTRLRQVHYEAATADGGKRTSKQFHKTGGPAGSGIQFWGKGSPRIRAVDLNEPLRWNKKPFICDGCGKSDGWEGAHEADRICSDCDWVGFHRRRVFSLSLGDWLDDEAPIEWLAEMLDTVRRCENLDWLLVTKRPELWRTRIGSVLAMCAKDCDPKEPDEWVGLGKWLFEWVKGNAPANVMVLTSVENQKAADERIPALLTIPAARRGLSCEPLLGETNIIRHFPRFAPPHGRMFYKGIDWVIAGGESGTDARPCNIDWIRDIVKQCQLVKTPVFVKQLGIAAVQPDPEHDFAPYPSTKKGDVMAEWPKDLQVREFYR